MTCKGDDPWHRACILASEAFTGSVAGFAVGDLFCYPLPGLHATLASP